ncbi:hypothetical protein JRO89_XS08G0079100 [Xanthoceras sorbifolium]|uniref:LysM domain-containing protein n=1 Tax=Xanthoceras sorbifolium TaxID=99658 RepID=A0ABQ8HP30_9ROSI|nr:hypothetical protein JRO89_XS08G0079100 [Xanthoceras sorbifolium]
MKPNSTSQCDSAFGVASGDTCYAITQQYKLTVEVFDSINPNINRDALFVGQWVLSAQLDP